MTVSTATAPDCYPLLRLKHEHGHDKAVEVLAHILTQADVATGIERERPEIHALWASLLLGKWSHLSVESFIVAIRDGLNSGKVYGKLNLPQLSEWMTEMDERISTLAENEAMQHKEAAQNLGRDYLDRLQHESEKDKRKLQRANSVINELERRLSDKNRTDEPTANRA